MRTVFVFGSVLIILFLSSMSGQSAFEDIGIGARPLGMGGAFVAVADDANASAYNPAGLGYITNVTAGFTHVQMVSNVVSYDYVSIVAPLNKFGSFGISFGMLSEESNIYSEKNVAFSYSRCIIDKVSLGSNFRMIGTSFDKDNNWVSDNPYFAETSVSGFTLDIGILAKPSTGLSIGLSGENLIPADISISKSDEEKIPVNLRLGIAYKLSAIAESAQQPALREVLNTTSISLEGALRDEREVSAIKARMGIEAWFANQTVGLRAGYNIKKVQENSSSATMGGSIRLPIANTHLRLDYAMQIFGGDIQDKLAHRISVVVSL